MSRNGWKFYVGCWKHVVSILSSSSSFQNKNLKKQRYILKTIYLLVCRRQNITWGGHTEENSNFVALKYRAVTDKILADHLQNNPMNERYLLPYIKKKWSSFVANSYNNVSSQNIIGTVKAISFVLVILWKYREVLKPAKG